MTDEKEKVKKVKQIDEILYAKLEDIRNQALHELQTSEDAWEIINAGYKILYSYGYEGNELKKGFRGFSGDFHRF